MVKEAKENLSEAKNEFKDAKVNESEAAKAKEIAEWNNFKIEADSSIANIENGLKNSEIKIEKVGKKDKRKLKVDYAKAKSDIEALKEKLHKKNVEFENDIKSFDKNVSEKINPLNESSNMIWMNLENHSKTCLKTM